MSHPGFQASVRSVRIAQDGANVYVYQSSLCKKNYHQSQKKTSCRQPVVPTASSTLFPATLSFRTLVCLPSANKSLSWVVLTLAAALSQPQYKRHACLLWTTVSTASSATGQTSKGHDLKIKPPNIVVNLNSFSVNLCY